MGTVSAGSGPLRSLRDRRLRGLVSGGGAALTTGYWLTFPSGMGPGQSQQPIERRALFTGEGNKRRGTYPARCRMCKRSMEPLEQLDGRLTLRILPYLIGVMAWLSGKTDGPPKKVPLLVPEHLRVFVADEQRAEQRRRQQALEAAEKESFAEHPPP